MLLLTAEEVPDGSDVVIQNQIRDLGWPKTHRMEWSARHVRKIRSLEEISNNSAVARYLQKPIERGKVKPDEYDCVTVDAYLTALGGERIATEHKIKISFPLPNSVSEPHSANVQMERMFAQFSARDV